MKRVFLKLSGEALAGEKHTGFDEPTVTEVARQVKQITDQGIQVGIVIGGGNFWRGRTSETIDRTKADQIGMLTAIYEGIYVSWGFPFPLEWLNPDTIWCVETRAITVSRIVQISILKKEWSYFLQEEPDIRISPQIQALCSVRLRWRQRASILQKQSMVSTTVIQRSILLL